MVELSSKDQTLRNLGCISFLSFLSFKKRELFLSLSSLPLPEGNPVSGNKQSSGAPITGTNPMTQSDAIIKE